MIRVLRALFALARVTLGILWLREGIIKWHAGFGAADISLVVQSTRSNDRVPGFYQAFTDHVLANAPGFFGIAVPVLETSLGVLLIAGAGTRWVALVSIGQLASYWLADQLIWEYPIMLLLSAGVAAWPVLAQHYSLETLLRNRRPVAGPALAQPRW